MINDELLHKWVNDTLKAEELEIFKLRPEYDTLVTLYKNTEGLSTPELDAEPMLAEILKAEKTQLPKVNIAKRRLFPSWLKYGVAAAVLLLAGWFFWPKSTSINYELAKGEREEGILPDESTFVLNAESKLSYDLSTWKKKRSLELNGEAFFKVKKGSAFTVNTPNGIVQVLGTQFNVLSRKGILEVKCLTGKVAVRSANKGIDQILNPNDAIRISSDNDILKWQLQNAETNNWVNGISSFREVPLSLVLDELERQFDIKIDVTNVNTQEIISCNFQHQDLNLALKTTLDPMKIKYELRTDKKVILMKE